MVTSGKLNMRAVLLLLIAAFSLCLDVNTAYAQSSSCSRLQSALRQFDRNSDFRNYENNSQAARGLAGQVQSAESAYVRNGCNDDAKAGRTLTRECQGIARDVLRLRDDYAKVNQSVGTATAVAQQREAILQEMARFGCGAERGSSATFSTERQTLFERIFGTTTEGDFSNGEFVGDENWGYGGYATIRTVCVRLSDGYFWPISYATLPDYLSNDSAQCQQMCPNTPVELYYYDNPGQEAEQMRNQNGSPYSSLPNAFRYREAVDMASSCKVTPANGGQITLATDSSGQSRAIAEVSGLNFPLPLRDPRRQIPAAPVAVAAVEATLVSVPLPRPRPAAPGEAPIARPVAPDAGEPNLRLVQFGNKTVRVVGPDTPYAQPVRAGS